MWFVSVIVASPVYAEDLQQETGCSVDDFHLRDSTIVAMSPALLVTVMTDGLFVFRASFFRAVKKSIT